MHTLASAIRTCIAVESAVECTATVEMPISRQARMMRSAISPRLAMRTLSNISVDDAERLTELDRARVVDADFADDAALGRRDGVHRHHCINDKQRVNFLVGFVFVVFCL